MLMSLVVAVSVVVAGTVVVRLASLVVGLELRVRRRCYVVRDVRVQRAVVGLFDQLFVVIIRIAGRAHGVAGRQLGVRWRSLEKLSPAMRQAQALQVKPKPRHGLPSIRAFICT